MSAEQSSKKITARGSRGADCALEQMQALAARLVAKQEAERLWAARELHDVLGQSFTLMKLILDSAKHADPTEIAGIMDEALAIVDEATDKVRRVSRSMRPGMLDLSLEQSLEWLFGAPANDLGLEVSFTPWRLKDELPQGLITAVYRIVQEALDNVSRHAGVKAVSVTVALKGRNLLLEVEDEGLGFDVKQVAPDRCGGLVFMRERAWMMGGVLRIKSKPGCGTLVSAVFPLPEGKIAPPKPLC
jgi:signal transduction histidine kinase